MDITKMTEGEFLCDGNRELHSPKPTSPDDFLPLLQEVGYDYERNLPNSAYELHRVRNQPGDVVLVHSGHVVGLYVGDVLTIDGNHQGRGLSTPLVLSAIPHRSAPTDRKVTDDGLRALRSAWKVAHGLKASPWWP